MGFLEGQTDLPAQQEMNNPAIEPVAKKYAELRYQLIPYTYTLSREAYDTGMPLMRGCGCIIRTTSWRSGSRRNTCGAATC